MKARWHTVNFGGVLGRGGYFRRDAGEICFKSQESSWMRCAGFRECPAEMVKSSFGQFEIEEDEMTSEE